MEQELTNDLLTPEELFYSKELHLSYSALKKLLWSPKAYYNYYVLGQKSDKYGKELIEGKVIHCLLLNIEEFNRLFIVSPVNIPTGNNKLVVDKVFYKIVQVLKADDIYHPPVFDLVMYSSYILETLLELNLHQSLTDDKITKAEPNPKTADQKRLEKILIPENINYFEFLKLKEGRDVLDQETYDLCLLRANLLKNDTIISDLMGITSQFDEFIEVINEQEFRCNTKNYKFGLKGFIDNLVINHTKKIIYINDIKTTGKNLIDFEETVQFYQYWLQAIIYCILVTNTYRELLEQGYKLEFRFIVLDPNNQFYDFKVSDKTLNNWFIELEKILVIADYHYSNRRFNLPYVLCNRLIEL